MVLEVGDAFSGSESPEDVIPSCDIASGEDGDNDVDPVAIIF